MIEFVKSAGNSFEDFSEIFIFTSEEEGEMCWARVLNERFNLTTNLNSRWEEGIWHLVSNWMKQLDLIDACVSAPTLTCKELPPMMQHYAISKRVVCALQRIVTLINLIFLSLRGALKRRVDILKEFGYSLPMMSSARHEWLCVNNHFVIAGQYTK